VSASTRRGKGPAAKRGRITFTLAIEGQEMLVDYRPDYLGDVGHFEFRSPHEPPRRIPVSETGYRSYFAAMEDVKAASSPQDYAREVALALVRSKRKTEPEDRDQLPLFG
jgi:hypothetical protein